MIHQGTSAPYKALLFDTQSVSKRPLLVPSLAASTNSRRTQMSVSGSLFFQCFSLIIMSQSLLIQYAVFVITMISFLLCRGLPSRVLCLLIAELDMARDEFDSELEKGHLLKRIKKAHKKRYQILERAVAEHAKALESCDDLYKDTKALFRGRSFALYWCLYKVRCFRGQTMTLKRRRDI
ncbi:uncharacterized protein EV420DRAFT_920627 [Desarmillaria tabescens]|uniref:Uncharacterized protein n=1 Tax=Armillaria tabescens TaxID=1929756 RepID=A0AA39MTV0_ARMTA|nr:uncharacterized protein EV420DRAFT_920627 [Desarmillaria tabescens]KAK0445610.1 hypothetical protein EV420DRAFT_920627 [Desarmillaria tabescens]